jgi:hypothetical protein
MHITLNKLSYNLLETIRKRVVDDDVIDLRQVRSAVHGARGLLISQAIEKRPFAPLHDSWLQELRPTTGVQMITVDASQITGLTTEQYMRRTIVKIPQPLIRKNGLPVFSRIGPINRLGVSYDIVSQQKALSSGYSKYTRDYIKCFQVNGYVYATSGGDEHQLPEYLDFIGVFQNPEEVYLFNDINGDSMNADSEQNYPIDLSLEIPIRQIVLEKFLGIKVDATVDYTNNAAHDQEKV